jgi:hypothetical protein
MPSVWNTAALHTINSKGETMGNIRTLAIRVAYLLNWYPGQKRRHPMKKNTRLATRIILLAALAVTLTVTSTRLHADTGTCGSVTTTLPFNDVMSSPFFCQIAEAFFSGLTNGTSATTYSPSNPVTRDQMAAFITRTQDSGLRRGSRRAALDQFWTTTPNYPSASGGLGTTTVGSGPELVKSDGEDLWVSNFGGTVSQVHASNGKLLNTWTGATGANGVLIAMGRVFVTGLGSPGKLYMIDPTGAGGPVTVVSSGLGNGPAGIAFDGSRIWTANEGNGSLNSGSVSIITPGMTLPWSVTNVSTGFQAPSGILFDGSNIWVTDQLDNSLKKLDQPGAILRTVTLGTNPLFPAFDGTNIWVPNSADGTVSVVRAATAVVVATLSGNGLSTNCLQAAFDGQRIMVTNGEADSVSLWKAADLTPLGTFSTGSSTDPQGVCSDGTYFWITLTTPNQLGRF